MKMKKICFAVSALLLSLSACNKDDDILVDVPGDETSTSTPVISFPNPENGYFLRPGETRNFKPDVQNIENATYIWKVNGIEKGNQADYNFVSDREGVFYIDFSAVSSDGKEAALQIKVTVTDKVPVDIVFPKQMFFSESDRIYAAPGEKVFLNPYIKPGNDLIYSWSVNDEEQVGEYGPDFCFVPQKTGTYTVCLSVMQKGSGGDGQPVLSAQKNIEVVCIDPAENRAPDGGEFQVLEYVPAPGQFINDQTSGFNNVSTHDEACRYVEKRMASYDYVSLGSWGGRIVVKTPGSIRNSGSYDFSIMGNATDTSNEPGIVWVMQDTNGNGIPDEQWFELKGSDYDKPGFLLHYAITYYRPAPDSSTPWIDINGVSGYINRLSTYHSQPYYYPAWVKPDSYTLYGTLLGSKSSQDSNTGMWTNYPFDWGYADNLGSDTVFVEADGMRRQKNRFKISDAVCPDGSVANLNHIDFIMVQTGNNNMTGWLGENSTEVCGFFIENR